MKYLTGFIIKLSKDQLSEEQSKYIIVIISFFLLIISVLIGWGDSPQEINPNSLKPAIEKSEETELETIRDGAGTDT